MSNRAKTTQEFQEELDTKYPGKYTIIGNYVNAKTKVRIRYNSCMHENDVRPSNLLDGFNCPICRNEHRVTHEEFVEKIERKYPGKYTVMGVYSNNITPIKVMYNKCGHVTDTRPVKLSIGSGCPICNPSKKISVDEFKKRLSDMYGDNYELVGEYVNYRTEVLLRHNACGTVFHRTPTSIFSQKHNLCPACFTSARGGIVYPGINDIHTLRPDLEKYMLDKQDAVRYGVHSEKKIWWKCPDCGQESEKVIANVSIRGFSCKACGDKVSYGERFVMALLDYLNVDYIVQYTPLWVDRSRYDFYVRIDKNEYMIEVDGSWHYIYNNMTGQSAEEIAAKDMYKEMIASVNGIKIIRVDYNYGNSDRYTYIENSVIESELSSIFDISSIDFNLIHDKAKCSQTIIIAEEWNSCDEKSIALVAERLKIKPNTVREKLYLASKIGLIKETREEIIALNRLHGQKLEGKLPVKVICNETGEVFESMESANKKYHACLTNYFRGLNKTSGHLPDGTRLTWSKIED